MPHRLARGLCLLSFAALPALASADALVRIACFDANEGAEITLNGVRKGACPLDLMVAPGNQVIRARKQPDARHEQLWETTLSLADGAVKRVEVTLGAAQLTADARREQERQAKEQAQAALVADMAAARGGDEAALGRVVASFEAAGNTREAASWRNRLERVRATRIEAEATGGSVLAMEEMAGRYDKGQGVDADAGKAAEWRSKAAAQRQKQQNDARRAELIRRRDNLSFFKVTKGMLQGAADIMSGKQQVHQGGESILSSCIVTDIPVWLASDTVSAPFRTAEMLRIKKELEALAMRPATWSNPDSLLARAERQPDAAR